MTRRPKIRPVVWHPPMLTAAARRPANPLPPVTVVRVNGVGPEDVAVDRHGRIFTGVEDGRILRLAPDGHRIDTVADTGGRPLGIEVLGEDELLVCDGDRGLLRVEVADGTDGAVHTLVARGEQGLRVCNNAAVAADGTIYFSDSSQRFDLRHWRGDLLEHSGTGRLLRRDPGGAVEVLLDGLHFANGVALAPDESFVVVAQTGGYRLDRLWLTGPLAGSRDVLADNLPGFPDNISTGTDGLIWIAMANPRNRALDAASRLHPAVRRLAWALPQRLQDGMVQKSIWVRAVDVSGRVVHDYHGRNTSFFMVTGVREHHGRLCLGSLQATAIALLDLP